MVGGDTQRILKATLSKLFPRMEETWIIRNQTVRRIAIDPRASDARRIFIAPFGERRYGGDVRKMFKLDEWEQRGLVKVYMEEVAEKADINASLLILLAAMVVLGVMIPRLRTGLVYWVYVLLPVAAVCIFRILHVSGRTIVRHLGRIVSMVLVVAIGCGLPLVVIYYFGGVRQVVWQFGESGGTPLLLARMLQLAFISIVSLAPALLYFLFDRQQLGTLREGFYHDIIMLDPGVVTVDCAKAKYGKRVDEVYGPDTETDGAGRLPHMTCLPVFGATLLIALGWIVALAPFGPSSEYGGIPPFHGLLLPHRTPVNFAFLGAYFFAINLLIRRYARADLKPKAYSHITVRILSVVILAWCIPLLFRLKEATVSITGYWEASPILLILAFLVGIVPETGVTIIVETFRSRHFMGRFLPSFREKNPLDRLEGINLYDRARLLEEGVENIENLVNHDIIDLMLGTRIPVPRLVDWIDQGILYMHCIDTSTADSACPEAEAGSKGSPFWALRKLRGFGIRTATDLIEAGVAARERKEEARFLELLDEPGEGIKHLQVILDTLEDDEWLAHVKAWRQQRHAEDKLYTLDDFFNVG